jgi:5-methylcytosine-specific restriction endonuclease McrA
MPGWYGSTRRVRLPKDWPLIRARILARDGHACTWDDSGRRCGAPATDVDHIVPNDDHSDANLRALCRAHHQIKSSAEGGRAAQARRPKRTRPREAHPGLL